MEVHKPKPMHDLREFLGEVGIIVIGVLIALFAEQIVASLHWRHEVGRSSEAIAGELGDAKALAIERVRAHACVQKRLDLIAAAVGQAAKSGHLEPLGDIGYPPNRSWTHNVWEAAVQNQITAHIPSRTQLDLSSIYAGERELEVEADRETEVWARLYALSGRGAVVDPTTIANYRSLISQARYSDRLMSLVSAQLLQGLAESSDVRVDETSARKMLAQPLTIDTICRPVGAVPTQYGEAPFANAESEIAGGLKWAQHGLRQ